MARTFASIFSLKFTMQLFIVTESLSLNVPLAFNTLALLTKYTFFHAFCPQTYENCLKRDSLELPVREPSERSQSEAKTGEHSRERETKTFRLWKRAASVTKVIQHDLNIRANRFCFEIACLASLWDFLPPPNSDLPWYAHRRKTRSTCWPWTGWSCEISKVVSWQEDTCLRSTTRKAGTSSKTSRP